MVYSARLFVLCLALCYFFLVFFSPFGVAIGSLEEERAGLGAFRTFVRFALVWFCRFPLPFGVWGGWGLRFVIVALAGLFSYLFFLSCFLSYCCDWYHCSYWYHLFGEERTGCFAFRRFVLCVLSIVLCLLFLLVSSVGYVQWLWTFLDIFTILMLR